MTEEQTKHTRYFESMTQFSIHIEDIAREQDITHLEALVLFCEESGAEYEAAAELVSPTLKQRIYEEAITQYAMPKLTAVTLDDDA